MRPLSGPDSAPKFAQRHRTLQHEDEPRAHNDPVQCLAPPGLSSCRSAPAEAVGGAPDARAQAVAQRALLHHHGAAPELQPLQLRAPAAASVAGSDATEPTPAQ